MAYYSPFRLLPTDTTFPVDPIVIQQAKKRLLAEFELGSASVAGMSKHDALEWLENLDPDELYYHKLIYERSVILNFLEKGKASPERWYTFLPADDKARAFIQNLVQQHFDTAFAKAYRENNTARLVQLGKFELPELERKGRFYFATTMSQITGYYHQLLALAQNLDKDKDKNTIQALEQFVQGRFFKTMGSLPPYFDAMRNEFARTLLQAAKTLASDEVKAKESLLIAASGIAVLPELVKEAYSHYFSVRDISGLSDTFNARHYTSSSTRQTGSSNTYPSGSSTTRHGGWRERVFNETNVGTKLLIYFILVTLFRLIMDAIS